MSQKSNGEDICIHLIYTLKKFQQQMITNKKLLGDKMNQKANGEEICIHYSLKKFQQQMITNKKLLDDK